MEIAFHCPQNCIIKIAKRLGAAALAAAMVLTAAPVTNPTTVQAATSVTVTSQKQLNQALKKSGVADIRNYTGKKITAAVKGEKTTIKAAKAYADKTALVKCISVEENQDSNLYFWNYDYAFENVLITVDEKMFR